MNDRLRLSNDEMQHVVAISRAIQNARRGRDGPSRTKIALTLLTFAVALVDDDIDGAAALRRAMSKLVHEMEDVI
jgi:hypothetical protein